ncbi:MAG: stage III sporulation protein AA [Firmicutes bacterium]|jgi:stage III sporulation protein AA|nr:stage III sporulation protein AA [Candidatus Fermentithermobacillaceae bacterium]
MSRTVRSVLTQDIMPLYSSRIRNALAQWISLHPRRAETIREVRLRAGLPLCIGFSDGDELMDDLIVSQADIEKTLSLITDCSYYALEDEFKGGYITVPGGHRVGLSGQVIASSDGEHKLRHVSALCFRIAREVKGVAEPIAPQLMLPDTGIASTLVISPPGCGKTTFLRDLCRLLGNGMAAWNLPPAQVAIVDERSEIAACYGGAPQLDVGPRADVLDRCPKAKGINMLLRSMNPDFIVTDELGGEEDARSVALALSGGVKVIASCHGKDLHDIRSKPYSEWLVSRGYFTKAVVLSKRNGPGTVEYVGDIN